MEQQQLKDECLKILSEAKSTDKLLTALCELLKNNIPYYNWVGFYFANHRDRTLHLRAFAGAPTDHTIIPFGKGICGQVAESNANFMVPDVSAQDNYIACSMDVKSELVVPLFKGGENIGQIDIDSHSIDPFTSEDEELLEWINLQVAKII